jgi:hypothetical protein
MLDKPQITQTPDQLTAVIRLTIPRPEIRTVMGPGVRELMAAVAAQGIAPTGPWFSHHLRMEPNIFDFEISVPVTSPVAAVGRVKPGLWPATKVARTVYRGPIANCGFRSPADFRSWLARNHTQSQGIWLRIRRLMPKRSFAPLALAESFTCRARLQELAETGRGSLKLSYFRRRQFRLLILFVGLDNRFLLGLSSIRNNSSLGHPAL